MHTRVQLQQGATSAADLLLHVRTHHCAAEAERKCGFLVRVFSTAVLFVSLQSHAAGHLLEHDRILGLLQRHPPIVILPVPMVPTFRCGARARRAGWGR